MDMTPERRQTLIKLGVALFGAEFPVGQQSREHDGLYYATMMAVIQMVLRNEFTYSFHFAVNGYPECDKLEDDYDCLSANSQILLGQPLPTLWRQPCAIADQIIKDNPHDLGLDADDWGHAVARYHSFWLDSDSSRYKAQSKMEQYGGYCSLPEVISTITDCLEHHKVLPS